MMHTAMLDLQSGSKEQGAWAYLNFSFNPASEPRPCNGANYPRGVSPWVFLDSVKLTI